MGLEVVLVRRNKGLVKGVAVGMKSQEQIGENQQYSGTDCMERVGGREAVREQGRVAARPQANLPLRTEKPSLPGCMA